MIDKKTELKKLYTDAVQLHLVHNGCNPRNKSVRIVWNDENL